MVQIAVGDEQHQGVADATPDAAPDVPSADHSAPPSSPSAGPMPLALGAVISLLAAIICEIVLDSSFRGFGAWAPGAGVLVSLLVMSCALLFLVGVTGKLRFAVAILLAASVTVAATNRAKLSILAEPVVPADLDFLKTPGFLLSMVEPRSIVTAVAALVGVVSLVLVVGHFVGRRYRSVRRGDRKWRAWVTLRLTLTFVCGALLLHAAWFNSPNNVWRAMYAGAHHEWAAWGQVQNYQENGFIGGFLYNLPTEAMTEPPGYSSAAMQEITDRYVRRAAQANRDTSPTALGRYNIVLVLSESFGDPSQLKGLELDEDPIPQTRQVSSSEWGGQTLTAFFGTGTSTMEFQSLTGQAGALFEPQLTTPFQQLLPGMDDYPSAIGWLKDDGYRAVAIHAFSTELYHRREIYPMLGFDDFVHDTTMQEREKIEDNPFISDRSAYDEVLHQIVGTEQPLFVHLVTMQNHGPTVDIYSDPVGVDGVSDDEARSVGGYARGLSHTDAALPGFLNSLRSTGEPTVVVFFGDHFPGVFSPKTLADNSDLALRTTPLFIWSSDDGPSEQLGITNPIDFLPLAMQRIGAPLPPYYELLREVRNKVGAIDREGVINADGEVVPYSELDAKQAQLVRDLTMVQYDFSVGKRYALDEMWYSPTQQRDER